MKKILLLISLVLFVGAGCSTSISTNPLGESMGDIRMAPAFSLESFDGEAVSSVEYAGQPLVINSWATWCTFCKKELPEFAEVQEQFGNEVTFIAINRAESLDKAKKFTDERDISDAMIYLLDPSDSFYKSIGGFSMPETLFVRGDGSILFHKRGIMSKEEVVERVEELVAIE